MVDQKREKLCFLQSSHGKFVDYDEIDVANVPQKLFYYSNERTL